MKVSVWVFLCFLVPCLLVILTFFLGPSVQGTTKIKSGPFECGFLPLSGFCLPFSLSFFVVSLMFLLFDVEILMLAVLPLGGVFSVQSEMVFWVLLFLILFSTLYEWSKGVLKWV